MKLLELIIEQFHSSRPSSAAVAKERLQIIVAHERRRSRGPDFLQLLQRDILEVVRRYVRIAEDQIRLSVDRNGEYEVLELNIALPEAVQRR